MTKRRGVAEVAGPSGTVTFLFTDVEGSTQRWARDRAAMQEALRLHDGILRKAIATHGGYVFKTIGDEFCAAFTTPESAASAALAAQLALGAADFTAVGGLRVRMAIHAGSADERDGDYFGPAVNRVARLLALAHGGQVLLSGIVADLVRENSPPQTALADLGSHALKDFERDEQVYQLVAPGLQRDFPALRTHKTQAPWMIPDAMRTRYFTGREDLLARLRAQLQERHRAALGGLGGVGKTQAAIEYAARHRSEYLGGVFWVDAETIGGLTSGFVAIAQTLRLPAAKSNDQEQAVRAVVEFLTEAERWLVILDNVVDRLAIQPFVPEHGTGDLLITSRESVFAELGIPRALDVQDLDADESVRFLLARTGREDADSNDRDAAAELATELGNLPLALEQAAAYIAETNASFSGYVGAFRKRRVTLLERAVTLVAHDTVAVTWAANFSAVNAISHAAADVLRISALVAPDAIPFELFIDGAQALGDSIAEALADPDDLAMAEVLRPLTRYSLVRSDSALRTFGVHRLVQEIVWATVADAECKTYVERAVRALDAAFPEERFATWAQCERLVPHVVAIARWVNLHDVEPEVAGRILNKAGIYLRERGRYAEAQALHERALGIGESAPRPDHADLARTLNNLGVVQWDQGRCDEAQVLFERALAIGEVALGPDDPEIARSLNGLALVHRDRGRYAEAQVLFARSLAIWERALGSDHPRVAVSLNNLGESTAKQGRYAEAQPLLERALAVAERALGPDHPDVGPSLNNLGETYAKQGRYAEAEALFERSLGIRQRALGPEHPLVAYSLTGFANLYVLLGQHAQAETLFERALTIRQRALGADHPDVAVSLIGLASLRKEEGRAAEAAALFERALAIKERTFAPDHPELTEIRKNIETLRSASG